MRFLSKTHDGGELSGVTGYFLIEIKSLFSIAILRFSKGSREAFHNHAFNALTIWLKGSVTEVYLDRKEYRWKAGNFKYTPRNCFHKIVADDTAWAFTIRGPWKNRWKESRKGDIVTLTHGRKIVDE